MHNFKYIKISNKKRIRILSLSTKSKLYVLFLHGFKSDIEGEKPHGLYKFCKKKKIGFLALEYMGHGKSYGKFENGNITSWSKDTHLTIKKKNNLSKTNFVLLKEIIMNILFHYNL